MKQAEQQRKILGALASAGEKGLFGLEIAEKAGLESGSFSPALANLERRKLVVSRWQGEPFPGDTTAPDTPPPDGRPRRRYYRITGAGREARTAPVMAAQPVQPKGAVQAQPGTA